MRIFTTLLLCVAMMFSTSVMAMDFEQNNAKISASGANGPAPNSGDGVPDGSGFDGSFGPYGN